MTSHRISLKKCSDPKFKIYFLDKTSYMNFYQRRQINSNILYANKPTLMPKRSSAFNVALGTFLRERGTRNKKLSLRVMHLNKYQLHKTKK